MQRFYRKVVNHSKLILYVFIVVAIICVFLGKMVSVNYDMSDYLPEGTASTTSLDVMQAEFDGGVPNARIMISDITIPQALEYKEKIKGIDGVIDILWLDDSVSITTPLEMYDAQTVESYYKDNMALYTVTIDENKSLETVNAIREVVGEEVAMSGSAVSTAVATVSTVSEIAKIAGIAVLFVLFILLITTTSWIEPLVVMAGLGVAILINNGTNLIFGEISFVTNAAGSILQLAVSLDYSVFLLHRFYECRKTNTDAKEAMVEALYKSTSSISSSGLTTVIGFLALCLMRFGIGPDLGLALAKGIAISLITVFVFSPALILATYKLIDKTKHRSFMPKFDKFGKVVSKVMIPLVGVFAVVIVPSYLASNQNDFYYGASKIFNEQTKLGQDTVLIEENFGKSNTYVLMVPKGDFVTEKELSTEIQKIPQVTGVISYVDTVGVEIPPEYLDSSITEKMLSENYSRIIINTDADHEGKDTFKLVEQVRNTANKYYQDTYYLAGESISTYDLMDTITADMVKVNLIAIGAVLLVLVITMKSITVPMILVLSIETAIWLNLAIPYFRGETIFYIAYLIISSVQLGATVDYAILFTDRYKEHRQSFDKKEAIIKTISTTTVSILTSGITLTVVGFLLGYISTHGLLSQLGSFLGIGTMFSLGIVLFVLPGLLYIFDSLVVGKQSKKNTLEV